MFLLGSGDHGGKSGIRKWYEKVTGVTHHVKDHAKEGGHGLLQTGEGLVVGGLLGAADAQFGLDVHVKGHEVPADAVAAGVLLLGATAMAKDPVAAFSLRGAAASAATVFGYRKGKAFVAAKKAGHPAAKTAVHGEFGAEEDPIIRAARSLT